MEKRVRMLRADFGRQALSDYPKTKKKKKIKERTRMEGAGTEGQKLDCFLPRFPPSGLGFDPGFCFQMAASEPSDEIQGRHTDFSESLHLNGAGEGT